MSTKSKTVSMRLTKSEHSIIKAQADEAGVSVSRFMVNAATADDSLSATTKQQVYQHKTVIKDLAKQLANEYDDSKADKIIKEIDEIWQLLK